MAIKIQRGIKAGATRTVLYGTEGIGKSTLAAQWPNPLVLDTEDGTGRIDCARVVCQDWMALHTALVELGGNAQGFQSVIVDSVDWAERLMLEAMLRKDGKASVEDYGFGKGFTKLAEQFGKLLALLDGLIAKGVHVVLVGHSTVKRTTPPDMDEGWDRYELKLSKQVSPLVKEWADVLLFANYRTRLVEGSDGRTRAKGGKERSLYAERTAAWDAKNRYGLWPELPMSIQSLAPLFAGKPPAAVSAAAAAADTNDGEPPLFEVVSGHIAACRDVRALGRMGDRVDVLASEGQLTADEATRLEHMIKARHDEIEPAVGATT
jgi:hypothetical protein